MEGKTIKILVVFLFGVIGLTTTSVSASGATTGQGWVRFGHFAAAKPADVFLDGAMVAANLGFGQLSAYEPAAAGIHHIAYNIGGKLAAQGDVTLADQAELTVSPVVNKNTLSLMGWPDATSPPEPGKAMARIINADPSIASLNVTVGQAGTKPLSIAAIAYKAATGYVTVPPGSYDVNAVDDATGPKVLGKAWPIAANTITSIVVLAGPNGPTIEAITDTPSSDPGVVPSVARGSSSNQMPVTGANIYFELAIAAGLLALGMVKVLADA